MKNWRRTFLKRMEQELEPYRVDSIFLEEEGQNPDTLRQMFDTGEEVAGPVVMDMAVFVMEDGKQLLQFFTELFLDVDCSRELLNHINDLNLSVPLGVFGYFTEGREVYHKYNMIVSEPENLEKFVQQNLENVDIILGEIWHIYNEISAIIRKDS